MVVVVSLLLAVVLMILSAFSVTIGRFVPGWAGLALLAFTLWLLPRL